jgi:hypothetical protein
MVTVAPVPVEVDSNKRSPHPGAHNAKNNETKRANNDKFHHSSPFKRYTDYSTFRLLRDAMKPRRTPEFIRSTPYRGL